MIIGSPCGLFDGVCGACEYEMDRPDWERAAERIFGQRPQHQLAIGLGMWPHGDLICDETPYQRLDERGYLDHPCLDRADDLPF